MNNCPYHPQEGGDDLCARTYDRLASVVYPIDEAFRETETSTADISCRLQCHSVLKDVFEGTPGERVYFVG